MRNIRNQRTLIENGKSKRDKRARRLALTALEEALKAADAKKIIESKVGLKDGVLKIGLQKFDLNKFRHIFVVGGGKASGKMAEALESIVGDQISSGIVNIPYMRARAHGKSRTRKIRLQEASHPIPDEAGIRGTREMLSLADEAGRNDLVICLVSGGGSSLMTLPRGEITLSDKRLVTNALLKCGAAISEVNAVRKHISDFKGGWLAEKASPATVVNLILSDVIGDPLDSIASGPTVPDSTTFSDAVAVLRRYRLWNTLPETVKTVLDDGAKGLIAETPKKGNRIFRNVHSFVVGNNRTASLAACDKLRSVNLSQLLLTSFLEGEARHVGTMLASIAKEIGVSGSPIQKPCGVVAGGETTVTVVGDGKGGRNQEVALSAALKISGLDGVAVASLSTDGIDGPTEAAGAIVDGNTLACSQQCGLDAEKFLDNNDSYSFFLKLDDAVFTGLTETNVNDVSIIVAL